MIIMYLTFGFACGLIAATAALLAGAGFFTVFGAYTIGGMIGVGLNVAWALKPERQSTSKHSLTQQG